MHRLIHALIAATCLVSMLAAAEPAPNLIRNSSFEVGTDNFGVIRGEYLKPGAKEVPFLPLVLDTAEKFHGSTSLRIDNPNGGSVRFFTRAFAVDPGKRYVVSFAAKSGIPGQQLQLGLETAEGRYGETGQGFATSDQWQRFSTAPLTVPDGRKLCKLQLVWGIYSRLTAGTSLWLDAFQVREEPDSAYAPRPLELGVVNGMPRQYTQSRQQDVPVSFKVCNHLAAATDARIRWQVQDEYFGKVVLKDELKAVALAGSSTIELKLANVSPKRRGKFVLQAELVDGSGAVRDRSEFAFAVIDSVKRGPGQFTDDYSISNIVGEGGGRPMGFEGDWTDLWTLYESSADEMFDFHAQAGDRWLRSWDFNWNVIEPRSGEYNWTLTDLVVQKAKDRGIRVLPTLGDEFILDRNRDLPQWLCDDPASTQVKRTIDPSQQVVLPAPDKWVRYVRACAQRYAGTITHYEILNEPNLYITPEAYLGYLKSAYETIRQVDPKARIVAFSSSQDHGGFAVKYLEDCFKLGALKYCDVVSFHPYGARLEWSKPLSAEGMTAQIRTLMDRYDGSGKGLWVTELFHICKPGAEGEDDNYLGRSTRGHEDARRFLIDLASGVGRSFTVPEQNYRALWAPKSWAVNTHLSLGMDPSSSFVIRNTLATLFEGAKPAGEVALGATTKLMLFTRGLGAIAAAWSADWDDKPGLLTIPGAAGKLRVLDIMGNPDEAVQTKAGALLIPLSNSPVYLQPTGADSAGFLALLKAAVSEAR